MPTNIPKNAFSIPEFQVSYGIGPTKIYEEIGAGRLKARKVGGRTVILAEDALDWARSLPILEPAEPEAA